MAELDRSVFENIHERDRFATDFDAAYPVGWSWTVLEDRVVAPTITLGYPVDLDRGILELASADSGWSIHTVGSARWFPTFTFGEEVDETNAIERIEAAAPGTIPEGALVEAIVAELRLVAQPEDGDDVPDNVSQDEGERIGGGWATCARFGSASVAFHPEWDKSLLSQLVAHPVASFAIPEGFGNMHADGHGSSVVAVPFWADSRNLYALLHELGIWDPSVLDRDEED
ncbi:hypothetical protein [Nocardia sp. NPDC060249]|uniref:hypothetical protein n=1 Tax=Nocardia sp. NPDC060249 TaxID=3347082 RepID=UPI003654B2A1